MSGPGSRSSCSVRSPSFRAGTPKYSGRSRSSALGSGRCRLFRWHTGTGRGSGGSSPGCLFRSRGASSGNPAYRSGTWSGRSCTCSRSWFGLSRCRTRLSRCVPSAARLLREFLDALALSSTQNTEHSPANSASRPAAADTDATEAPAPTKNIATP